MTHLTQTAGQLACLRPQRMPCMDKGVRHQRGVSPLTAGTPGIRFGSGRGWVSLGQNTVAVILSSPTPRGGRWWYKSRPRRWPPSKTHCA